MAKIDVKTKVISLKPQLDYDAAEEMVDSRKVKTFQTLLHKPKKSEVHLHSLTLHYESILLLSGKYSVDFIRDADHTLHVDKDVQEVIISDEVFPVKQKRGVFSKLEPSFKNKIKIIGVGGIDSGKSAYEKFISGASYIQLYTGMVYQGPNIVNSISEELNDILSSDGVKNIEEIVGSK